jgi:hypothetical protein
MPLATTGESTVLNACSRHGSCRFTLPIRGNTGSQRGRWRFLRPTGGYLCEYWKQPNGSVQYRNNPIPHCHSPVGNCDSFWSLVCCVGRLFLGLQFGDYPKSIDTDDIARWEIGKLTVTTD